MEKKERKPRGYWTLERCKEDAKRFGYTGDWRKEHPYSWGKARKIGWLDECCKHMAPYKTGKKQVMCIETGEKFESITSAYKKMKLNSTKIGMVCRGVRKHTGGYTFKYVGKSKNKTKE